MIDQVSIMDYDPFLSIRLDSLVTWVLGLISWTLLYWCRW